MRTALGLGWVALSGRLKPAVRAPGVRGSNDEGHFDQKEHTEEIRKRLASSELPAAEQAKAEHDLAASYARQWTNRRKPKTGSDTTTLFHPDYVLPLGGGQRVWMDRATASDLMAWGALEVRNTAMVLAASGRRQGYIADRLDAFKAHPEWTLRQVELNLGWVDEGTPVDESDDEFGDDE